MKRFFDIKRLEFYLWVGLVYLVIWLIKAAADHPDEFWPERAANEFWRAIYIVAVNYFFFEYILPYIQRNWKKILLPLLAILGQLFLYGVGLYIWRSIGIRLGLFTDFSHFPNVSIAVEHQMSAGMASLFFFGIIRHVYGHIKLKQAAQQLRIEKQAAELNYLKSQTNPHFLFNTLNNIYSLSRDKSDLAPDIAVYAL
jgi:two-component system, LytTR family, sensor kinase